jgi:uncharacterized membrane protein YfcA
MTFGHIVAGIVCGLVAGALSGVFGIGGGSLMTPAIQVLLGAPPIVALATPLPAIFPTATTGAITYQRAGEADTRAARWMLGPGLGGAALGAYLTKFVNADALLLITALILAWQALRVLQGRSRRQGETRPIPGVAFAITGLVAGLVSGLLGIGGGLIMVPALATILGMPLKRSLGTSLLTMVAFVVPGTIVHAALGHINWGICAVLIVGAVPGAAVGARYAVAAGQRAQRLLVGWFLLIVSIWYGANELVRLVRR